MAGSGILMGLALLLVVDSVSGFLGSSPSLSGAIPLTRGFRGEGSPPTSIPDSGSSHFSSDRHRCAHQCHHQLQSQ